MYNPLAMMPSLPVAAGVAILLTLVLIALELGSG